jgi:predicted ester cyclase
MALVGCGQGGDDMCMAERSLRESYQAIIRAVAAADLDALDRLIDPDITDHNAVPGQVPGRAGIKYWVSMMHDAFADLTGVVEDTVLEGDKIAARVTWRGTHRGDFVGIQGTGLAVTMQSVQILRFTDGLATDWWGTADVFGVLRQVGASVAPPAE